MVERQRDLCNAVGYVADVIVTLCGAVLYIVVFKYILCVVATSFQTQYMQQRFSSLLCVPHY